MQFAIFESAHRHSYYSQKQKRQSAVDSRMSSFWFLRRFAVTLFYLLNYIQQTVGVRGLFLFHIPQFCRNWGVSATPTNYAPPSFKSGRGRWVQQKILATE